MKKENQENQENKEKLNKTLNRAIDEKGLKQSLFDLTQPQQDTTPNENFRETIEAWLDKKHINFKTRLNPNQVVAVTILKTLATKWKVKCIEQLIQWFITYKLSEGGKSSEELVNILKNRPELNNDNQLMNAIEPFLK